MNIVFDLGAVVFRWEPAALVREHFQSEADTDEKAAHLARLIFGQADWLAFDQGQVDCTVVIERTAERLGLNRATLKAMIAAIPAHMQAIEGTRVILEELRSLRDQTGGFRLFYLSNMPVPIARGLERHQPVLTVFDGGIFSGDVHCIKPQPAIFELLCARYQLEPSGCVFVDDSLPNVESARRLGWRAIHHVEPGRLAHLLVEATALPMRTQG